MRMMLEYGTHVLVRVCLACSLLGLLAAPNASAAESNQIHVLPVTVVSDLPCPLVPIEQKVDFTSIIHEAGLPGVWDPNSVEVVNVATGETEPHALSQHFHYGDQARVRWIVRDPSHKRFEIRFKTSQTRPELLPLSHTPMIGVGDLLRCNTGKPQTVSFFYVSRLIDMTGDGAADLVGCDCYTTEPMWPEEKVPANWRPVYCYPRVDSGSKADLLFGNALRLRYRNTEDGPDHFFTAGYVHADAADFNGDGLPDVAFTAHKKSSAASGIKDVKKYIHLYLNSGKRHADGMPILVAAGRVPHPDGWWGPIRAVDLNRDGAIDFVVGMLFSERVTKAYYIKNTNPKGWPIRAAEPVKFDPGKRPSFYDVDGDGRLDSICMVSDERAERLMFFDRVAWRKNLGGDPPRFGPPKILEDIDEPCSRNTTTVNEGSRRGVLVSSQLGASVAFYEQIAADGDKPRFRRHGALSVSAPVRMGDQSTPHPCDWDGDGDLDLLLGGGLGWVRVVFNEGTNRKPVFSEARPVLSEGKPISICMSRIFPGLEEYYHDLGYVHPAYVDWDADGLPDLMVPNLSNRIFWYKNIGTRKAPRFGPRQQVVCDGFPENAETIKATARLLGAETKEWTKRIPDPNSAFWWRSRAGFGDFNGDGLADMITADGQSPLSPNRFAKHSSLFVQYRDDQGKLRLRKDHTISLPDGSLLKNASGTAAQIIPVDWDGDGLLDIMINDGETGDTAPAVLRNIGTKTDPRFDFPKRLACWGEEMSGIAKHGPYYGVGDLDGDGKSDLLACTEPGTYLFFRRTAMDMNARPKTSLGPVRTTLGKTRNN